MNIRGDLKILRDLYITTSNNDALEGKVITSVGADGKTMWSDVRAPRATSRKYRRGALVTDSFVTKLYMAIIDDASGGNLYDVAEWLEITGSSSSGGGSVVDIPTKSMLPEIGDTDTLYVVQDTGSLYRWEGEYIFAGGGTDENIKAAITVGGIITNDHVVPGTNLNEFIEQLINPVIKPTKEDVSLAITGIPTNVLEVGSQFKLDAADISYSYFPGKIISADTHPEIALVGGELSHEYKGSGIDTQTGEIDSIVTVGLNAWSVDVDYEGGNPNDKYYDSKGEESDIFDNYRLPGTVRSDSKGFIGKYKYFWFVGEYEDIPSQTEVRTQASFNDFYLPADNDYTPQFGLNFIIDILPGNTGIAFYIPEHPNKQVKVLLEESSFANDTTRFTETTVFIKDANDVDIEYRMFTVDLGGTGFSNPLTHYIVQLI